MFTKFIFSGKSVCRDQLCQKLFQIFSEPSASKLFPLNIPSSNNLPGHQNVKKHVHPGRTQEEIKERCHKSMFDLHYKNGATLHRIITEATEPVNSGNTSVTQSTSPTAKTTGLLISNTPDSPKNTKEHLVLVKSNYPAEQFIDKKKYLCSSTSCSSPECIQTAIYIADAVNASELSTLFGMRNTSKTNTRGKKTIYGSKQATTHTTQTKQTLTS